MQDKGSCSTARRDTMRAGHGTIYCRKTAKPCSAAVFSQVVLLSSPLQRHMPSGRSLALFALFRAITQHRPDRAVQNLHQYLQHASDTSLTCAVGKSCLKT